MSQPPVTIPKQPVLKPAEDYFFLRRTGIGFIEQMASRRWTDYNPHDPGITVLEALCYAITDLVYRLGWEMKDILAPATPPPDPLQPFPQQAFFTAREILTINPGTPDDFRRLLINRELVRNAWVFCKTCACDLTYYAWCENEHLKLSYQKPPNPDQLFTQVDPLGLYEVLLELEADPVLGDLNDRKIEQTVFVKDSQNNQYPLTLELRFPEGEQLGQPLDLIDFNTHTEAFTRKITGIALLKLSRSKTATNTIAEAELTRYWRDVFYASLQITFDSGPVLVIENAALRMYGNEVTKKALRVNGPLAPPFQYSIEALLCQIPPDARAAIGFVQPYRHKRLKVAQAVADAKVSLHQHRNLDEDYCRVKGVEVEEVAVCADVEVAPEADIERVQAAIWFEIAQYFNPPVPFYTLQEMMDAGLAVEDIFNGPALENGFIRTEDLEAARLKTVLRTSDIINRLMDIEGVIAVNNLLLSKYDSEGNMVKGAADPVWNNGKPVFDASQSSAAWLLFVSELHQPRLSFNLSRFLFYKNGLPFLPRTDEAYDTLTQRRGEAERPKIKNAPQDLPIPRGTFRHPEAYFPVQYSLPPTYGIGPEGLPSHASVLRRAQAKQLKAYLMVFEQLLGNSLAQVAHTADLFSLDPAVSRTYFTRLIDEELIKGATDLFGDAFFIPEAGVGTETPVDVLARRQKLLDGLTETVPEFRERRNRFLNHLMARFGEQFGEYALLLTNLQGQQKGLEHLIDDKIAFLKAYPATSHDRGKAFNYTQSPCAPGHVSGLQRRVSLLLGYPDLSFSWTTAGTAPGPFTANAYQLKDTHGLVWLEGKLTISAADEAAAIQKAFREIMGQLVQPGAYTIGDESGRFRLTIQDKKGKAAGLYPTLLETKKAAEAVRDALLGWSSNERATVVEHLLLRPKFPGDALFPACTEGPCRPCGEEDPYSFRLTFVMPGWTAPFNVNLEMRRFADRTIRQEMPSHLLGKVCWVGNEGFVENPCDPVVGELAGLLEKKGLTSAGVSPAEAEACTCAWAIYTAFSTAFKLWYEDKTLIYIPADALTQALQAVFTANVSPAGLSCTTVLKTALWTEIQGVMVAHFQQIALYGWQFERFEDAWCAWLTANAAFDWTEERLPARVQAMLEANRLTSPAPANPPKDDLCSCATALLTEYGLRFYQWMEDNLQAGRALKNFTAFSPKPVTLCTGFTFRPGTATAIETLLKERYTAYTEVSYRLRVVVHLLSKLRNTYPAATLHDCDDGSDQNPVRLGSTALGNL